MSESSFTHARVSRRAFVGTAIVGVAATVSGCSMFHKPKKLDPSEFRGPVKHAVNDMLEELKRVPNFDKENEKKPVVCFIGVMGESSEEVSKATRAELQKSDAIKLIEKAKMTAALKAAGLRGTEVFIPNQRKKFCAELGESFDYLLSGYVEDVDAHVDPNDEDSKTYVKTVFRLQLLSLETNRTFDFTADI